MTVSRDINKAVRHYWGQGKRLVIRVNLPKETAMPHKCAVIGCSNRSNRERDKRFYRAPVVIKSQGEKTEELSARRRAKWLANISRADLDPQNAHIRVCSDHFIHGKPSRLYPEDGVDWAPTLQLGHNKLTQKNQEQVLAREDRAKRFKVRPTLFPSKSKQEVVSRSGDGPSSAEEKEAVETLLSLRNLPGTSDFVRHAEVSTAPANHIQPTVAHSSCQTDLTARDISRMEVEIDSMQKDAALNRKEVCHLREKLLEGQFTESALENNDEKVRFYTGLINFQMLMAVFSFAEAHVSATHRNVLNKLTEFLITLMRLRLNIPFQDLAYRFKVSKSTVSRIFEKWVEVLDIRFRHLIMWPDRESLRKSMPMDFKEKFGSKVSVILDCFEVFIDRPSSLCTRAMTWSNYKHHNTVKFLLGITPQGVISFISDAYGGRASDKFITEHCRILENLLPGDIVMADRGFTIEESVGFYCAELNIPAFTKGKSQLCAMDVFRTRKIASVRIHVERVIGLVRRKYLILQGILPIEFLTVRQGQADAPIDKIARICCALTNLSNSVVPFD